MRDQLEVYKKLRQNHQKEVRILETRLQMEMNDHRRNLDREYDQQVHGLLANCLFVCPAVFSTQGGSYNLVSNLLYRVGCANLIFLSGPSSLTITFTE